MTSDNRKTLDNMEFAVDKLECYYRLLKIIKEMDAENEEIKLKLMEAITKH